MKEGKKKLDKDINENKEVEMVEKEMNDRAEQKRTDEVELSADPQKESDELKDSFDTIKKEKKELMLKCDEYLGMLQRSAAEFDNYKKRTVKEKENIYSDAVKDVAGSFIPVLDNLERAFQTAEKDCTVDSLKEGIDMVMKQLKSVFESNGVKEIKSVGQTFDPNLHNAVMHVEDEAFGKNEIIEEFQKGYAIGDKVIRYSMVKVAN